MDPAGAAQQSPATRSGIIALALAAVVAVVIVILTAVAGSARVPEPEPDATLDQTAVQADEHILAIVEKTLPWLEIKSTSFRGYGGIHGWEVWSALNSFESPCLVVIDRASEAARGRCAPSPAELVVDTFPHTFDDGGMGRFILRPDAVDVYVFFPPEMG